MVPINQLKEAPLNSLIQMKVHDGENTREGYFFKVLDPEGQIMYAYLKGTKQAHFYPEKSLEGFNSLMIQEIHSNIYEALSKINTLIRGN